MSKSHKSLKIEICMTGQR